MKKLRPGDTLIEVLFAFAILATITGFTFTAAIQGYKNAVQAQNQTQATFLAQYYADGLKTYRDSLQWSGNAAETQTFINGFQPTIITGSITTLPNMNQYMTADGSPGNPFCVEAVPQTQSQPNSIHQWRVLDGPNCDAEIAEQASGLPNPSLEIRFSEAVRFDPITKEFVNDKDNPDKVTATVRVGYDIPNAAVRGEVVNTIILSREQ